MGLCPFVIPLFSTFVANKGITFAGANIIPYNIGVCQYPYKKYVIKIFVDNIKKFAIIDNMKTQYTQTQLNRFHRFCDRHGLTFATIAEYNGALEQFFSEDENV